MSKHIEWPPIRDPLDEAVLKEAQHLGRENTKLEAQLARAREIIAKKDEALAHALNWARSTESQPATFNYGFVERTLALTLDEKP